MNDKYEPLPLHLCEMLEREFEKIQALMDFPW